MPSPEQGNIRPMLKALILLLAPVTSAALLFLLGPASLIACAALALGTILLSTGEFEESQGRLFDKEALHR